MAGNHPYGDEAQRRAMAEEAQRVYAAQQAQAAAHARQYGYSGYGAGPSGYAPGYNAGVPPWAMPGGAGYRYPYVGGPSVPPAAPGYAPYGAPVPYVPPTGIPPQVAAPAVPAPVPAATTPAALLSPADFLQYRQYLTTTFGADVAARQLGYSGPAGTSTAVVPPAPAPEVTVPVSAAPPALAIAPAVAVASAGPAEVTPSAVADVLTPEATDGVDTAGDEGEIRANRAHASTERRAAREASRNAVGAEATPAEVDVADERLNDLPPPTVDRAPAGDIGEGEGDGGRRSTADFNRPVATRLLPCGGSRGPRRRADANAYATYDGRFGVLKNGTEVQLQDSCEHALHGWEADADNERYPTGRAYLIEYEDEAHGKIQRYRFYPDLEADGQRYFEFPSPAFYWALDGSVDDHHRALAVAPWRHLDVCNSIRFVALYSEGSTGVSLPWPPGLKVVETASADYRTRQISSPYRLWRFAKQSREPLDASNERCMARMLSAVNF